MLVHNTLLRNTNKDINILYSHSDNKPFIKLLTHIYGFNRVALLEESIFAHKNVDLIICNNRLDTLDTCINLSHYFHVPLLIIDHKPKPENINNSQIMLPDTTYFQIAINDNIANSWNADMYNAVLEIDITNPENIALWKKYIENIIKEPFKIIETNETHEN